MTLRGPASPRPPSEVRRAAVGPPQRTGSPAPTRACRTPSPPAALASYMSASAHVSSSSSSRGARSKVTDPTLPVTRAAPAPAAREQVARRRSASGSAREPWRGDALTSGDGCIMVARTDGGGGSDGGAGSEGGPGSEGGVRDDSRRRHGPGRTIQAILRLEDVERLDMDAVHLCDGYEYRHHRGGRFTYFSKHACAELPVRGEQVMPRHLWLHLPRVHMRCLRAHLTLCSPASDRAYPKEAAAQAAGRVLTSRTSTE